MFAEMNIHTRKVKRLYNGQRKTNCLPVVDNSTYPTDPDIFKAIPSYEYVFHVDKWLSDTSPADKSDWKFKSTDYVEQIGTQAIKPLSHCKEEVYKILADKRWLKEASGVSINGTVVPTDRETSIIIAALPSAIVSSFKIQNGVFLGSKSAEEVAAIKLAHRSFIQSAFDWEKEETDKVIAMNYLELVVYLYSILDGDDL